MNILIYINLCIIYSDSLSFLQLNVHMLGTVVCHPLSRDISAAEAHPDDAGIRWRPAWMIKDDPEIILFWQIAVFHDIERRMMWQIILTETSDFFFYFFLGGKFNNCMVVCYTGAILTCLPSKIWTPMIQHTCSWRSTSMPARCRSSQRQSSFADAPAWKPANPAWIYWNVTQSHDTTDHWIIEIHSIFADNIMCIYIYLYILH